MLRPAVPVNAAPQELRLSENREAYYGGRAPPPGRPLSGPGGAASSCHRSEEPPPWGRGGDGGKSGGGGMRNAHRREKRERREIKKRSRTLDRVKIPQSTDLGYLTCLSIYLCIIQSSGLIPSLTWEKDKALL